MHYINNLHLLLQFRGVKKSDKVFKFSGGDSSREALAGGENRLPFIGLDGDDMVLQYYRGSRNRSVPAPSKVSSLLSKNIHACSETGSNCRYD